MLRNGTFALAAVFGALTPTVSLAVAALVMAGFTVPPVLAMGARWRSRRGDRLKACEVRRVNPTCLPTIVFLVALEWRVR